MNYPNFSPDCTSLLCKHLTKEIFEELKDKKSRYGYTLNRLIKSGLENPDSSIGVYVGDEESYEIFAPLLNPIIKEYHNFTDRHKSDMDPNHLNITNPDPDGEFILSTRIRVGRNLHCFPLGPNIAQRERLIVECMVSDALKSLDGELKGRYYPLLGMDKETQNRLIQDHFLFKEGDRFLESAGLNREWPEGRGIFHNSNKTFLVWINEEDQLRIISMQKGGDIKEVFSRLSKAVKELEKSLKFAFSQRLGYITSCPTNLGTAMRASVHIKLPKLGKDIKRFQSITQKYDLQIRGVDGEHSQSKDYIYDISNRRRLGVTEVEAIKQMADGVQALIETEKSL